MAIGLLRRNLGIAKPAALILTFLHLPKSSPSRLARKFLRKRVEKTRKWLALPARLALVRACARCGLDEMVVRLLLAGIEGNRPHAGALTVLCLDRQNFAKDIVQLRRHTSLNWLTLRHRYCGSAQMPFTPGRLQKQMFHFAEQGADVEKARQRATRLFRHFLRALRLRGIDAIMSANTDYWQDEAIRRAALQEEFPFLVLSREHYITSAKLDERVERYQKSGFQFLGTAVAVFGPATVETMTRPKVCPPERIVVTGAPRLDEWRDLPGGEGPAKLAVLISFARPQYGAQACSRETFREFAAAANRCPDPAFRFVVKCKNEEDRQLVLAQLAEFPSDRVQLVLGVEMFDLLSTARAVIGFNSLALLEALLGPAAIAVPDWADAAANSENRMLEPGDPLTKQAVDFAAGSAELGCWLDRQVAGLSVLADKEGRRQLLAKYFHYPADTTCSDEVARFVEHFVKKSSPRAGD